MNPSALNSIKHKFSGDLEKVVDNLAKLSISGDIQASKIFCEFMAGKYDNPILHEELTLNLTDEQASKIIELAQNNE